MHRCVYNGNRDVEENKPERDGAPEQKGDDPILIMAMEDESSDPPTREEHQNDEVKDDPVSLVKMRERVASRIHWVFLFR